MQCLDRLNLNWCMTHYATIVCYWLATVGGLKEQPCVEKSLSVSISLLSSPRQCGPEYHHPGRRP